MIPKILTLVLASVLCSAGSAFAQAIDAKQQDAQRQEIQGLVDLATNVLKLDIGKIEQRGAERNVVGFRTQSVLVSKRLDSRTYFVQDARYDSADAEAAYAGSDASFLEASQLLLERLAIPTEEVRSGKVLTQHLQTGKLGPDGRVVPSEVRNGKRYAQFSRAVNGVPVFSSRALIALTRDERLGFMELHWPRLPEVTVREAGRLSAVVGRDWRPPERKGARIESIEAGIVHSPALGFAMDIYPAIRVIYAPEDETMGRKLTLYLDEHGNDVPTPRQFEKIDEKPAPPRRPVKQ